MKQKRSTKRLSETQRKALRAELVKANGRGAKAKLARKYGVTWKNVDYHAKSMKKAKRAKVVTPATPPLERFVVAHTLSQRADGDSLTQPNGTLRVTLEIPRAMVEEVVRSETRHEVQNMLLGLSPLRAALKQAK